MMLAGATGNISRARRGHRAEHLVKEFRAVDCKVWQKRKVAFLKFVIKV